MSDTNFIVFIFVVAPVVVLGLAGLGLWFAEQAYQRRQDPDQEIQELLEDWDIASARYPP